VQTCSGLLGDFAEVRWFIVPQSLFPCREGMCSGVWVRPHSIYIAEAFLSGVRFRTVKHEMLHELLRGGLDHPPVFQACDLLVE
jgi:hypothetical protein